MILPIKLDAMVCTPWYPQNEVVFADGSNIKSYLLCVFVHCEHDVDLLCDSEEFVTGDSLELEFGGGVNGGNSELFDDLWIDEVAHCSRVNEGFEISGEGGFGIYLLYASGD